MVTNIDIGLAPVYLFPSRYFIRNTIKFTEQPGPQTQKKKCYTGSLISKQRGDQKTWKEQHHEKSKDEQHPNYVEVMKNFQVGKFGVKIKRKPYVLPFKSKNNVALLVTDINKYWHVPIRIVSYY